MSHSDHPHHDPHVPAPHEEYTHHHDAAEDHWYDHDPSEHPREAHGKINGAVIGAWMGGLFFGTLITVLVIIWIFERFSEQDMARKNEVYAGQTYVEITTQAQRELTTAGWVDAEQGLVHIPIDDAMDRVATQYQRMQQEMGGR